MPIPPNIIKLGEPSECRAFITHKVPALDYSALNEYASTHHVVYSSSAFPDQPDWMAHPGAARLEHLFEHFKFDPMTDYIVLSGDVLRIALVCALIGSLHNRACFLRYDRTVTRYWPFHVDLNPRGMSKNVKQLNNPIPRFDSRYP